MRHRLPSMLTTFIALSTLLGALGTFVSAPLAIADTTPALNGLHQVTDWMTYDQNQAKADPITVAIYGPGSFDVNVLHNLLTSDGWTDEANPPERYFTYSGDGVGVAAPDLTVTNNSDRSATRVRATIWASHNSKAQPNGFTFFAAATMVAPCGGFHGAFAECVQPGGPTNGRDQFADHVRQVFTQQGWTAVEIPVTGVGTSGVKVDQGVFDGRVTAVCVAPPGSPGFCNGATTGTGAGGGQPRLSVAFDHDTYGQGGAPTAANGGNPVRLAPGQTSAPIVAYFRNTSPANTLYRSNVVLASYLPDNDQPAQLNLCNPAAARQCSPVTMIWLDHDCPPQALCSFTYTLRAPANFTGTETLNWRVMVIHQDGAFDSWVNGAANQQQLEFYDVVATQAGG